MLAVRISPSLKQPFYLFTIVLALTACHQKSPALHVLKVDSIAKVIPDTLKPVRTDTIAAQRTIVSDSLVLYDDTAFADLESELQPISKNEFIAYKNKYKPGCSIDSGHFISGSGLYVNHSCNEVCETYLAEKITNRKMPMPSPYDAGILDMLLSPGCNLLMVCSSYDGPDYENYYTNRAEIMAFHVTTGHGLQGITPAFKYFTKDWSIEDATWVSDKTIALKLYEESRGGDGSGVHYKYFKMDVD